MAESSEMAAPDPTLAALFRVPGVAEAILEADQAAGFHPADLAGVLDAFDTTGRSGVLRERGEALLEAVVIPATDAVYAEGKEPGADIAALEATKSKLHAVYGTLRRLHGIADIPAREPSRPVRPIR